MERLRIRASILGDDDAAVRNLARFLGRGPSADAEGVRAGPLDGAEQMPIQDVSPAAGRPPVGIQWECWDLPRSVLEAQPQVYWNVACGHGHSPRCAVVVADALDAAIRWAAAYRQQAGSTEPIVLAWYGAQPRLPTRQQAGINFAAIVPTRVLDTGAGVSQVFAEAAKAVLAEKQRLERPAARRCVVM
jgi:hypothetical protein